MYPLLKVSCLSDLYGMEDYKIVVETTRETLIAYKSQMKHMHEE